MGFLFLGAQLLPPKPRVEEFCGSLIENLGEEIVVKGGRYLGNHIF